MEEPPAPAPVVLSESELRRREFESREREKHQAAYAKLVRAKSKADLSDADFLELMRCCDALGITPAECDKHARMLRQIDDEQAILDAPGPDREALAAEMEASETAAKQEARLVFDDHLAAMSLDRVGKAISAVNQVYRSAQPPGYQHLLQPLPKRNLDERLAAAVEARRALGGAETAKTDAAARQQNLVLQLPKFLR
jgi:hypothetical protein